jgi:hypothetical protein
MGPPASRGAHSGGEDVEGDVVEMNNTVSVTKPMAATAK